MAHFKPRKSQRRGNNHIRIVDFNQPVVTYPPVPVYTTRKLRKAVVTLRSLFL